VTIKFNCPRCGQRIGVPDDAAGTAGNCPRCGAEATVPPSPSMTAPLIRPPSRTPTEYGFKSKQDARPQSRRHHPRRLPPSSSGTVWGLIVLAALGLGVVVYLAHDGETPPVRGAASPPPPANRTETVGEPTYNGKSVSEWADAFCDPKTSSDAVVALVRIGPQALPSVLEKLRGHGADSALRASVYSLIRTMQIYGADVAPVLEAARKSDDPDTRSMAERALEPMSEEERAAVPIALQTKTPPYQDAVVLDACPYDWNCGGGTCFELWRRWGEVVVGAFALRSELQVLHGVMHIPDDVPDATTAGCSLGGWCSCLRRPLPEMPADWQSRCRAIVLLPEDYLAKRQGYEGAIRAANLAHERWLIEMKATGQTPSRER